MLKYVYSVECRPKFVRTGILPSGGTLLRCHQICTTHEVCTLLSRWGSTRQKKTHYKSPDASLFHSYEAFFPSWYDLRLCSFNLSKPNQYKKGATWNLYSTLVPAPTDGEHAWAPGRKVIFNLLVSQLEAEVLLIVISER